MDIKIDAENGTAYITLIDTGNGGVARTEDIGNGVLLDYTSDGKLAGIDLLSTGLIPAHADAA